MGLHKVDDKTCRVTAKVVNSVFGTLKHDGEKWQIQGGLGSTLIGIMDPELDNLERTVSSNLESIQSIARDGPCLVVSFGGAPSKFSRAAKPSGAAKEDIRWLNSS